jgi:hypothetical protein
VGIGVSTEPVGIGVSTEPVEIGVSRELVEIGVSREPVEMGVSPAGIDTTSVEMGVSPAGSDMLPVKLERRGSVITETTDSETGGMLIMLPVEPVPVSIAAIKGQRPHRTRTWWAWWLNAILIARPRVRNRRLDCENSLICRSGADRDVGHDDGGCLLGYGSASQK